RLQSTARRLAQQERRLPPPRSLTVDVARPGSTGFQPVSAARNVILSTLPRQTAENAFTNAFALITVLAVVGSRRGVNYLRDHNDQDSRPHFAGTRQCCGRMGPIAYDG